MKIKEFLKEFVKKRKSHLIILGAGSICFILSLWVLNNYVLDRPSFCSTCHMVKIANDTWQKARHKPQYTKNSCNACHVEPGLFGSINATIYGVENLYVFLFGPGEDDLKAKRPVYCTQKGCHDQMEKSTLGKKIKVSHGFHMKMGYACVTCHDRVAHEEYGMVKANDLSMMKDFCFPCHNDEVAPRKTCGVCHVYQYRMLKGVETPENLVGMTSIHYQSNAEENCQNCHTNPGESAEKSCINCHAEDTLLQYQKEKADISQRLEQVKAQISESEAIMAKIKKPEAQGMDPAWDQTFALFQIVQKNYAYLTQDNSKGAHNRKLTAAILGKLESDAQRMRYSLYSYQRF
jgi:predicted CXXCH cytochrome family protein